MENAQLATEVERLAESLRPLPEPVAHPTLVVVSGLPGTGKSYFCGKLAERLPLAILESDALRKALFSSLRYSSQESSRLFRACQHLIEGLLNKGISLILDATNLSERYREHLYRIAERLDVKLVLVRIEAPPELVRQRLNARQMGMDSGGQSDADWKVYQRMKSSVQKITRNHYVVNTSKDIIPIIDKIVREVKR
jgi:hypothetical protein